MHIAKKDTLLAQTYVLLYLCICESALWWLSWSSFCYLKLKHLFELRKHSMLSLKHCRINLISSILLFLMEKKHMPPPQNNWSEKLFGPPFIMNSKNCLPPLKFFGKTHLPPPKLPGQKPVSPPTRLPGGFSSKFWSLPYSSKTRGGGSVLKFLTYMSTKALFGRKVRTPTTIPNIAILVPRY